MREIIYIIIWHPVWTPASLAFSAAFLVTANFYTILDILQPEWYRKRAVPSRYSRAQPAIEDVVYLNTRAVLNILLAYVTGLLVYELLYNESREWLVYPETVSWYLLALVCIELVGLYLLGSELFGIIHYTVHRIRWRNHLLNRWVHEEHHQSRAPIALIGLYASAPEMFIINIPLALLPPLILGSPPLMTQLYTGLLGFYIATNHSGHQLIPRWMIDVSYHDLHHQNPSRNYGSQIVELAS